MLRLSAHLGYLFTELPLEERLAAASEAGFAWIEHPNPYAVPLLRDYFVPRSAITAL